MLAGAAFIKAALRDAKPPPADYAPDFATHDKGQGTLSPIVFVGHLDEGESHTISARGMLLRCCTANTARSTLHKPVWRVAA